MEYSRLGNIDIGRTFYHPDMEEPYVLHKIVGAIDKNPEQGVILLDEKK